MPTELARERGAKMADTVFIPARRQGGWLGVRINHWRRCIWMWRALKFWQAVQWRGNPDAIRPVQLFPFQGHMLAQPARYAKGAATGLLSSRRMTRASTNSATSATYGSKPGFV